MKSTSLLFPMCCLLRPTEVLAAAEAPGAREAGAASRRGRADAALGNRARGVSGAHQVPGGVRARRAGAVRRRPEAGFSLLEALLAAAVLAGGVLLASQGFSLGARAAALGRQYTEATLLAQSRLAELMLEENLAAVETEGEFTDAPLPGAHWSFVTEETATAGLTRVTVTVAWGSLWGERQLTLSTLRPEFTQVTGTGGGSAATPASSASSNGTGGSGR